MRLFWYENPNYCTERALAAAADAEMDVFTAGPEQISFSSTPPYLRGPAGEDILALCDAVLIRKFAPYVSEAMTVARLFADAGKPVFDPALADEGYAISKMHDYILLAAAGLPIPRSEQPFNSAAALQAAAQLGYPVILKGVHGTGGHRVHKADSPEEASTILQLYPPGALIVQEFLPAASDWRVIVIGGEAIPVAVERKPMPGDFRTNTDYSNDLTPVARAQAPELFALAEAAAKHLRRSFAGVDLRMGKSGPVILEVNRRPGFRAFEGATGINVAAEALTGLQKLMRNVLVPARKQA
jgi:RimK family alpha-L-glutamate ligase